MKKRSVFRNKLTAILLSMAMVLPTMLQNTVVYAASDFAKVGGWMESIYAEIAGVEDADVTEVSYEGAMTGSLTGEDMEYLVRSNGNGGVRIDIPGLKAGTYTLTVKVGSDILTKSGITVSSYDRSGYAHFKYSDGVGAYNDDGTLKENAIVLYVTDENKNDVTVTCGGTTVQGIGNILNSAGQDTGSGTTSKGGTPNTNQDIIRKLALAGTPLVVRFIGTVSESGLYARGTFDAASAGLIDGLTDYNSLNNGGSVKDNGHMARIQSGKDITLEGIGYDAVIDGWGFHYMCQSSNKELGKSFEVRNLTFINTPEDAIGMEGIQENGDITASVERCWIHNNEFYCPSIASAAESDKSEGDGSMDFKRGMYMTCSYNYFEGCHKTNLVGSADDSLQFNLTYHHNYWYMCKARGPLTRQANVHMYNNIIEFQTDYAMNTRANAYIFSEYNLFYVCKSPQAVEGGAIKSYQDSISSVVWNKGTPGTVVTDKSTYVSNNCGLPARNLKLDKFDVDSALSYIPDNHYQLENNFTDVRKVVTAYAGVQQENPKTAEEITVADYSVVPQGTTVQAINSLPQNLTPGKISKTVYAFSVNAPVNVEVAYASADAPGVLVNEAGENLLEGDGTLINLPAGTYMIQPVDFQPGKYIEGTAAQFKEITINTLNITAYDPNAHYHSWVLDEALSTAATCTEKGKNVFSCSGCSETKEEDVAALGHAFSKDYTIDVPATDTTDGEKSRHCTRTGCDARTDVTVIPAGSGSNPGGGSTDAGDYVLTFTGLQENDSEDFFTVTGKFSNSKGSTVVNGVTYTECLKMESSTEIKFSCNEGATLFLAFGSTESGKKVKIDTKEYTTDSNATVTTTLSEGEHSITKKDSINLFYASVANTGEDKPPVTLTFNYNYEDAPEALQVQTTSGTSYATLAALAPETFARSGYNLIGLYTDAACTNVVEYPFVANEDSAFYAEWEDASIPGVTYHSLLFDANGGSAVAPVQISNEQIYVITQTSTKSGFTFAGWFDAAEGGNQVESIDGSTMTGDVTVYAHWNTAEDVKLSLDCATDLTAGNIAEKTTINGFTIHALPGGVGEAGSENPKYYMTVKSSKLYTNGVRIPDTTIEGNEDGLLKAVEFTTQKAGVLTVELALSGSPSATGTYQLVLAKKGADDSVVEVERQSITKGTTKDTFVFELADAATYFFYPEGDKGVAYYSFKVSEPVYSILYLAGNGTPETELTKTTAKAGEVIVLPNCVANAGYEFLGWTLDGENLLENASYTVKAEDAVDGVITISAKYNALTYTVKFDANGGTLPADMEERVTASCGESLTLGRCIPKPGKKFLGWKVGNREELIFPTYIVRAEDADSESVIVLTAEYGIDVASEGLKVTLAQPGETYIYTGKPHTPAIIVTNNGKKLVSGVDYTVKYTNNVKATTVKSKAKITVTGKGNLTGSASTTFEIAPRNLADVEAGDVVVAAGSKASPILVYNNYKLTTADFKVADASKKFTEDGVMVVTGQRNFEGTIEVPVKVVAKAELKKFAVTVSKDVLIYNGDEQYPSSVKVTDAKTKAELTESDYEIIWPANVTDAGTITFTVVGRGAYTGSVKKTYTIKPLVAAAGSVAVSGVNPDGYEFKTSGAVPGDDLVVTYSTSSGDVELLAGKDYKVTYSNNKKVSTEKRKAGYTVTFIGNYKGTKALKGSFAVVPASIADAKVTAADKIYTGKPNTYVSKPIVTLNGVALKTTDYTVKYYKDAEMTDEITGKNKLALAQEAKAATVYVKVTGKGNYLREDSVATGSYKVCKTSKEAGKEIYDLSKARVTIVDAEGKKISKLEYTGKALKPSVKVEYKIGKEYVTLEEGTEYEVTYVNNVNKGKGSIVITGTGDKYVGSKTTTFTIVAKNVRNVVDFLKDLFS